MGRFPGRARFERTRFVVEEEEEVRAATDSDPTGSKADAADTCMVLFAFASGARASALSAEEHTKGGAAAHSGTRTGAARWKLPGMVDEILRKLMPCVSIVRT
jgi:hypothetical protein